MMRPLVLLCVAAVLAGCGRPQDRTVEEGTARDTVAAAPAAATISLADIAGKWKIRSTDEAGGNVVETELLATADTSGWTLTGPKRKPIPVRVIQVAGDSIITEAGPYESFLRKGVQVRTRNVSRLQNGKLMGTIEARFAMGGRDSVAHRKSEGTRVR
jgi:hypothetical protein